MNKLMISCLLLLFASRIGGAQTLVWDGQGAFDNWSNSLNWNPNALPAAGNDVVINQSVATNLDQDFAVRGLDLSLAGSVDTNGHFMNVGNGGIDISLTSRLTVSPQASDSIALRTTGLNINNLGRVELAGGRANIAGSVNINGGGILNGFGTIHFLNGLNSPTTIFTNDGSLSTGRLTGAPATEPFTLTISAVDADARIDLDGSSNNRPVIITENTTLDLDARALDFGGTMTLHASSVFDADDLFQTTGTSVINVNATTTAAGVAEAATLRTASYNALSGSQLNVNSGLFSLDSTFFFNPGASLNVDEGAQLRLAGTGTVEGALTLGGGAELIAAGAVVVDRNTFDWDGPGSATTTVEPGATLSVIAESVDPVDGSYGGAVNINGGSLHTNFANTLLALGPSARLRMDGNAGTAELTGESLDLQGDLLAVGGTSRVRVRTTYQPGSSTFVAGGANLVHHQHVFFNGGTAHTGDGAVRLNGNLTVNGSTTVNMPAGTFELDNVIGNQTANINADLTLNVNATGGELGTAGEGTYTVNIDNASSTLTVNLTNPQAEWTLGAESVVNITGLGTLQDSLAGSDLNIRGRINVNDSTRFATRIDLEAGSIVEVGTHDLHLTGGSSSDPNTITGAFVSGSGRLLSAGDRTLAGFGTINPDIDFLGNADLRAEGGTLVLNGALVRADVVEVAAGGRLQFNAPFNTSGVNALELSGGIVQGQPITNDGVIRGHGVLQSIGLINPGSIAAEGGTLTLNTVGQPDLDAFGSTATLSALAGDLVVVDALTDDFSGTANVSAGRRLEFQAGWTQGIVGKLSLAGQAGNPARLTGGPTLLRGTVTVNGMAEIDAATTFDPFSDVQLQSTTDQLSVRGDTVVQAGASFTGQGALVNEGTLTLEDQADVEAVVANRGTLEIAGPGVGQVTLEVLDLLGAGEVHFDLQGTGAGTFDAINIGAFATIAGTLDISLSGFLPSAGDTFPIISSAGGATIGTFSSTQLPSLPGNLRWSVNYLGSGIQLEVTDLVSGDFNGDGDYACNDIDSLVAEIAAGTNDGEFDLTGDGQVDGLDLEAWLAEAGAAELASGNPYLLGDANLDGAVDGQDFVAWNGSKFTSTAAWCSGDFNADGNVDGLDFVLWNAHKFTSADLTPSQVPEPTGVTGLGCLLLGSLLRRSGTSRHG